MPNKLSIPVILGTNRKGRSSYNVANFILNQLKTKGVDTQLFDVKEFNFPQGNYGKDLKTQFPEYRDAVIDADGLVIVTPEYNHGYPGPLKTLLDMLSKEYNHKAVGLVGVSSGSFGGSRVIESMLPIVRGLGLTVTNTDLNFSSVRSAFNDDGKLIDDNYIRRSDRFLDELFWICKTLKWGRENVQSE